MTPSLLRAHKRGGRSQRRAGGGELGPSQRAAGGWKEKLPAVGYVRSDERGLKRRPSEDRVTPGLARAEQNESALPQTADIRADIAGGLRRAISRHPYRANCAQVTVPLSTIRY